MIVIMRFHIRPQSPEEIQKVAPLIDKCIAKGWRCTTTTARGPEGFNLAHDLECDGSAWLSGALATEVKKHDPPKEAA